MRSTSGPAAALSSTSGAISANATTPVIVALPVVVSMYEGIAIIETGCR